MEKPNEAGINEINHGFNALNVGATPRELMRKAIVSRASLDDLRAQLSTPLHLNILNELLDNDQDFRSNMKFLLQAIAGSGTFEDNARKRLEAFISNELAAEADKDFIWNLKALRKLLKELCDEDVRKETLEKLKKAVQDWQAGVLERHERTQTDNEAGTVAPSIYSTGGNETSDDKNNEIEQSTKMCTASEVLKTFKQGTYVTVVGYVQSIEKKRAPKDTSGKPQEERFNFTMRNDERLVWQVAVWERCFDKLPKMTENSKICLTNLLVSKVSPQFNKGDTKYELHIISTTTVQLL